MNEDEVGQSISSLESNPGVISTEVIVAYHAAQLFAVTSEDAQARIKNAAAGLGVYRPPDSPQAVPDPGRVTRPAAGILGSIGCSVRGVALDGERNSGFKDDELGILAEVIFRLRVELSWRDTAGEQDADNWKVR